MTNPTDDQTRRVIPPYDLGCDKCGFLAACVKAAENSRSEAIEIMAIQASITHRITVHTPDNGQLPW